MNTQTRPPVIVVLGHVDHGKTTLLDKIRSTNVAGREFGGITQHIGAYEITTAEGKKITFIDTPGHEAFSALRARGASVADLALLLVAADSGVQKQTVEAYEEIKKTKLPFIVVINKVDLPNIIENKVEKDLEKLGIMLEGRGGEVPYVKLSAKTGKNLPQLLELINLYAEMHNLTWKADHPAQGVVVECKKDKRGIVPTIILKDGVVHKGDSLYFGTQQVKVRSLINDQGKILEEIKPCTPVEVLGCKNMVPSGTKVGGQEIKQAAAVGKSEGSNFSEDFFRPQTTKFNFIIKADTWGTEEVIRNKFAQFAEIKIIKSSVGDLTDNDLEMAKAGKANILLFNVSQKKDLTAKAELSGINIFSYNLIYELLDEVEDLIMDLRVKQEKEAKKTGEGRIIAEFVKNGQRIAGIKVLSGKLKNNTKGELMRGKKSLGEITIVSLYRKSQAVIEVSKTEECGAIIKSSVDFKIGDIVKLYAP